MPISVAILGATGLVGQKAIALLLQNPQFKITELSASDKKIGYKFGDICNWKEKHIQPTKEILQTKICHIDDIKAEFIISCLPSDIALRVEKKLAENGKIIFSNAQTYRMHQNVPLIIPEINSDHLCLLKKQETKGKIITNPNCAAVGASLAIAPIQKIGTIEHISIVTLQSISGAGYPGLSSMDILSNTIPYIKNEAEKISEEIPKILGTPTSQAQIPITTHVHRVPVNFGHTVTLHIKFEEQINVEQIKNSYNEFNKKFPDLFVIHNEPDRPQAIKDIMPYDMSVHIGKITENKQNNIIGLISLTHNLVRGAAGAAISNMISYIQYIKNTK